jgi:hypothetical protein
VVYIAIRVDDCLLQRDSIPGGSLFPKAPGESREDVRETKRIKYPAKPREGRESSHYCLTRKWL